MKQIFKKPKLPLVLIATFAYVGAMTLYGEYIVSREVHIFVQGVATLGGILLSTAYVALVYNFIVNTVNQIFSSNQSKQTK